jgi:hypothetical protein
MPPGKSVKMPGSMTKPDQDAKLRVIDRERTDQERRG